jgi:hypothetical protein
MRAALCPSKGIASHVMCPLPQVGNINEIPAGERKVTKVGDNVSAPGLPK